MKKMTYVQAIENALTSNLTAETVERLTALRDTLVKRAEAPRKPVDEAKKEAANAARKEKTAAARAELVSKVAPVLREYLTEPRTAKELFAVAETALPADFSAAKVQNILLREMREELTITEAKGKANTYCLRQ